MRRWMVALVVLGLVAAGAGTAFAGPGIPPQGSNVYPNGAEGFWMGAAPPPGFYYVNYDLWYTADRLTTNSGSKAPVPFDVDVFANVSRFIYISNQKILGANWGAHVFVVLLDKHEMIGGASDHVNGLGDMIVDPFILAWHWPTFHVTTGVDIYVPTGRYDGDRLVNLSANAFVYEPIVAFTYMTPLKGLTTSAKFMYDIAQKNDDFFGASLDYGQEFHFDYSIDYMFNENWKAGIEGYYYLQTTDAKVNGMTVHGLKGMTFAVGPGVEYSKGRIIASWRTEFEVVAKNRPQGITNWLRVVIVL